MSKYDVILIAGPPGVGKSTHGKMLAELPGYDHISMGDEFRDPDPNTELGGRIVDNLKNHDYQENNSLAIELLDRITTNYIYHGTFDPDQDYLVIDGFPRTDEQVKLLTEWADVRQMFHIYYNDDDLLLERMTNRGIKNRPIDKDTHRSKNRIKTYRMFTVPTISHYHNSGIANTIDGSMDIETVHDEIMGRIARKQDKQHAVQKSEAA